MGVYIPNMDMPKSCVECHWYYECYDKHCTLGKFLLRKYPTDVSEEPYTLNVQRHPKCPLIEIDLVRCKDCRWYDKPHIEYNDGTRKDVEEDELWVTSDVGINVSGTCKSYFKIHCLDHDREDPEDRQRLVIFRHPTDFCSYGERREE